MTLSNPFNKSELKSAIQDLKQNLANSFQAIDEKTFFQKPEKGWSPAENIQHMNRVTKVLGLTYVTPKFIASFIFGETNHKSKTMNEMATIYLDALRQGKDSGFFAAKTEKTDINTTKRKEELIRDWNSEWEKYKTAIDGWSEEDLDKILMPHPFLGKITAREMYMVGILHPVHHASIVANRLGVNWNYF